MVGVEGPQSGAWLCVYVGLTQWAGVVSQYCPFAHIIPIAACGYRTICDPSTVEKSQIVVTWLGWIGIGSTASIRVSHPLACLDSLAALLSAGIP